jgi:uncharacterized membrane protein
LGEISTGLGEALIASSPRVRGIFCGPKESIMRKRLSFLLMLVIGVLAISASTATAAANFHGTPTFAINNAGQLICSGDVSGLGNVSSTEASCTATSTVDYQCINNGGKNPTAGNKRTVTGDVGTNVTVPVHNGRATANISVNPEGPGSFSCPSGQSLFLVGVCYSDITLTIGGASATEDQVCASGLRIRQ